MLLIITITLIRPSHEAYHFHNLFYCTSAFEIHIHIIVNKTQARSTHKLFESPNTIQYTYSYLLVYPICKLRVPQVTAAGYYS